MHTLIHDKGYDGKTDRDSVLRWSAAPAVGFLCYNKASSLGSTTSDAAQMSILRIHVSV